MLDGIEADGNAELAQRFAVYEFRHQEATALAIRQNPQVVDGDQVLFPFSWSSREQLRQLKGVTEKLGSAVLRQAGLAGYLDGHRPDELPAKKLMRLEERAERAATLHFDEAVLTDEPK